MAGRQQNRLAMFRRAIIDLGKRHEKKETPPTPVGPT
jgi:hypothetical protein